MKLFVLCAVIAVVLLSVDPLVYATDGGTALAGWAAPYSLVVVVLDCSTSFQSPSKAPGVEGRILSEEALKVVQDLFAQGAAQRRRRTDGDDRYLLVAADAASQVIWQGSRADLEMLTPEALRELLAVRRQFAGCTDLEAAMNAAARVLELDQKAAERYVLVFSDLLHEPAVGGYCDCAPPSGEPPAGVRWEAFRDASLSFFYVSKDYRYRPDLRWPEAVAAHGLSAEFLDAAQALSGDLVLAPPEVAHREPTPQETEEARRKFGNAKAATVRLGRAAARVVLIALFGLTVAVAFAAVRGRLRRRNAGARGRS